MNRLSSAILACLALVFATTSVRGMDPLPIDAAPVNIRVELQVVTLPQEIAVPLVAELMDEKTIEPAYVKVQGLLGKGAGKLIGWPIITTTVGQRAVSENNDEFRYATEYSAPAVAVISNGVIVDQTKTEPKPGEPLPSTILASTPMAFETRNTGVTLEVEPFITPDGKHISLTLVPQHVRLKGDD